ncbi:hypothetical protein ACIBFB_26645 [Nocardiopsis sp. NPDC050513]|uniref:hypothetical protein n=1 Tax=Nocardiopsis sp. NPDC050513 TaxID=3364338 RepID=UPI0037A5F7C3
MTEEFRAAFQRVLDTAVSQAPEFPSAVHDVFRLSSQVSKDELATAMEALAPVLAECESVAGVAADLAVLAGALVESGAPAGQVGLEVLRQLGSYGQAAVAFMHAWDKTGGGSLPAPHTVTETEEKRVEEVLGDNAPLATVGWWTSQRYGLAAKAMLGDSGVRAAVRGDTSALEGLSQIVRALSTQLSEFGEVRELLRMAEVSRVLVLDRASWRGFRVRFDGLGDNFQLHTLLADALVGKEGRGIPGTRPDPRWSAASRNSPVDPLADVVRGEWDLVGGDGTWVGNEAVPGDIPLVDGERVLVLEPQSLAHSWRAGRRHPHIPGSLEILEEMHPDEAAAWWSRTHPAGSVRHPLAPPIEHDDTGSQRAPRHFGVAAHFAEVDSGPLSTSFDTLSAGPDDASQASGGSEGADGFRDPGRPDALWATDGPDGFRAPHGAPEAGGAADPGEFRAPGGLSGGGATEGSAGTGQPDAVWAADGAAEQGASPEPGGAHSAQGSWADPGSDGFRAPHATPEARGTGGFGATDGSDLPWATDGTDGFRAPHAAPEAHGTGGFQAPRAPEDAQELGASHSAQGSWATDGADGAPAPHAAPEARGTGGSSGFSETVRPDVPWATTGTDEPSGFRAPRAPGATQEPGATHSAQASWADAGSDGYQAPHATPGNGESDVPWATDGTDGPQASGGTAVVGGADGFPSTGESGRADVTHGTPGAAWATDGTAEQNAAPEAEPHPWAAEPPPPAPVPPSAGDGRPPGAHLLPPMPPNVSESHQWAPSWRWPLPPVPRTNRDPG